MVRIAALVTLAVLTLGSNAWAQSSYGKAERRDPIFLRFAEMANRYWVNTETNSASHKVVAIPMPKQCSFLYADAYTRGQQSESEVQQIALSNCNRRLQELGPRFTLRLRWLQDGTFDTKFGAYEWLHRRKQMDVSRRKFHL